jgi:nuclear pore complex protein Nup210
LFLFFIQATVKVRDGSGYFSIDTAKSQNVNVTYDEGTKILEIRPRRQGKAKIVLKDLCVSTKRDTVIDVDVTGIGRIDVVTEDKIPLDGERNLIVSLHDHNGKILPLEIVKLAELSLVPLATDILKVSQVDMQQDVKQDPKLLFRVQGKRVGTTEVVFGAKDGSDGGIIQSLPKIISVFPPLQLQPRQMTILVGNKMNIQAVGGPEGADIVFSSGKLKLTAFVITRNSPCVYKLTGSQLFTEKQDVAWVSATAGEVEAKTLGKSVVRAKAVDPQNPKKVHSEDVVEVNVVFLTALRVVTPLKFVFENEKIPIWMKGIAGKTELSADSLASARPTLSYVEWIVSSKENAEIIYVFKERDMFTDIGKKMRVQFFAKKAGNITVEVKATYNKNLVKSQKLEMDVSSIYKILCHFLI